MLNWVVRVAQILQERNAQKAFRKEVRRICEDCGYDRDRIVEYLMQEFSDGKDWQWICNWIIAIPDAALCVKIFEEVEQGVNDRPPVFDATIDDTRE